MKRILKDTVAGLVLGLLVCAVAVAPSCAHVTPIVKDCSREAASGLLDDVGSVLITHDWKGGLADLVGKFGECVIEKAVAEVGRKSTVRAQLDELESMKAARANEWLTERGKPISMGGAPRRQTPGDVIDMCLRRGESPGKCRTLVLEEYGADALPILNLDLLIVDWPTRWSI